MSAPSPLTLRDVDRYPAGSPRRAVMRLLFWVQWGNFPGVVDAYHPAVVGYLGNTPIGEAYSRLRLKIATARPRLLSRERTPRGEVLIGTELLSARQPPERDLFRLRRHRDGWKVVFDTLLVRTLNGSAAVRVARDRRQLGGWAVRAGPVVAKRYRKIYALLSR